ncbi:MAG: ferredoxin [Methanobacterium sp.]
MIYLIESCGCCGACVAVCSNKLLELNEKEIIIREGCNYCRRCEIVCPLGVMISEVA